MGNDVHLDVAVLSKELRLLLLLLKRENENDMFSSLQDLITNINWDVFLQLTRHHRVSPYMYTKLKEIGGKWIPPYVIQKVYHEYQKNTFHMLHLSGEMGNLCKLLTENKIHVLLLKGPSLAVDLYGDLSRRTSSDLDMLISIDNLNRVHELLLEHDYVKDDYFSTVLNEWRWRHHHVTYYHSQKGIKLEIHWRLNPGPSSEPSFYELWERKRRSTLTGYPIYMLGNEDLFLFLVSHGARHGWSRLRWLVDIDRILSRNIDWIKLKVFLKRHQFSHVGGQALILSSELLSTPLHPEMRTLTDGIRPKRLAQDALFYIKQMVNLHIEPLPDDVAKYHKRHLFLLMSYQQRLLYILSFLYPYPMDVETLPLPKNLHFLYFPLRPFLWAWRKIRKHAWS
jgi:hypothetical protein